MGMQFTVHISTIRVVQPEQSFSRAMFSSPSTLFRVLLTRSSGKPISTSFCTCTHQHKQKVTTAHQHVHVLHTQ